MESHNCLLFIESEVFSPAWRECGLADAELFELQVGVMAQPKLHPVMKGTGGVRKMRFSPGDSPRGKSGSYRVCYVFFEEYGVVLLLTAYPKSQKDNISLAGRNAMRRMVERQHQLLSRGFIR